MPVLLCVVPDMVQCRYEKPKSHMQMKMTAYGFYYSKNVLGKYLFPSKPQKNSYKIISLVDMENIKNRKIHRKMEIIEKYYVGKCHFGQKNQC